MWKAFAKPPAYKKEEKETKKEQKSDIEGGNTILISDPENPT